jgi:hypothetical protein
MAKTEFLSGTNVLTNFLNAIFGGGAAVEWAPGTAYAQGTIVKISTSECLRVLTAGTSGSTEPEYPVHGFSVVDNTITWQGFGGHLHDSLDIDGSARKLQLTGAAEVYGQLPIANQVEHAHSGASGQFAKINLSSAANVTGLLPLANIADIAEMLTIRVRNIIDGFILQNQSGDYNDLLIGPGVCDTSDHSIVISSSSNIIKQIDAAWAVGSSAGGFPDSISIADNTWYHVFAIAKPDGSIDFGFDTSDTAANLLDANNAGGVGYTKYRRIGDIFYLDSTDKIAMFEQVVDRFQCNYTGNKLIS